MTRSSIGFFVDAASVEDGVTSIECTERGAAGDQRQRGAPPWCSSCELTNRPLQIHSAI